MKLHASVRADWRLLSGAALVVCSLVSRRVLSAPPPMTRTQILERARPAVGYSYWWGHGCWRTDGQEHGSCSGSCPNCTHTGRYGADCSGFVAKVWQVPSAIAVDDCRLPESHPYSTREFRYQEYYWTRVDRGDLEPADALVYRNSSNTSGHIFLYESGDGWGDMWVYEARGCSYGIVHRVRTASSSYVGIRRSDLLPDAPSLDAELVDYGSDATPAASPDVDFWTCGGADVHFWLEFRNTGQAVWHTGQTGVGGDVRLSTESGGVDAIVGKEAISLAESSNSEVRSRHSSPPGEDCNDAAGCIRTVFGPDVLKGQAPTEPGVYVSSWQLEDAEGGRFGPVVSLAFEVRAPDCAGRECGPDPLCGASCGTCPEGQTCSDDGHCVDAECQPECGERECGPDPVCGISCGTCPEGQTCSEAGVCEASDDDGGGGLDSILGGCHCESGGGSGGGLPALVLFLAALVLLRRWGARK